MKKILAGVVLFLVPLAVANAGFKFGPELGLYHGFGIGIQIGGDATRFELAAGYQPLILIITNNDEVRWVSTADFSGGLVQLFGGAGKKFRPGVILTGHYNTTLGFGLGAAFKGILTVGKMDVNANLGLKFYFNGQSNLEDQEGLAEADFLGSSLVIGIGAGLMF